MILRLQCANERGLTNNMNDSQIVWQGKSWSLRINPQTFANGVVVERAFIGHPGAVVLVPLVETAHGYEILILRQYRHALRQTILELPAGTRGWDEDWLICAQRELQEETGFRAARFEPLGQFWPAPGVSNELMSLYLARDLTPDPLPQDIDEEIEVVSIPLAELVEMAQNGRLQDAKSVVGILRTAAVL